MSEAKLDILKSSHRGKIAAELPHLLLLAITGTVEQFSAIPTKNLALHILYS